MPVETILKDWLKWGLTSPPVLLKKFDLGFSHLAYLIESSGNNYVLKCFDKNSGDATENSLATQAWAAQLKLAPTLYYSDQVKQYCLMEFIEQTPNQTTLPTLLARGLTKLHRAVPPAQAPSFALLECCDDYLNDLDERGRLCAQTHQGLLPALEYFVKDPTPWVFCHNDLVAANCLPQAERMVLIDWEYAALNNPWFDLAASTFYLKLTDKQTDVLFNTYWQNESAKTRPKIFYAALCSVIWLDILWFALRSPELSLNQQRDKLHAVNHAFENYKSLD